MKRNEQYLFISFSITKWDSPWYVRQKLMHEFAKTEKVIYVNPRKELRTILKGIRHIKNWSIGVKRINPNLILIESPWLFPKIYKLKHIDKFIDHLYHIFIKLIATLFGRKCVKLLYIWEPNYSEIRKYYQEYEYVYHPYDMFERYIFLPPERKRGLLNETVETKKKAEENEEALARHALVFYSVSDLLCDHYQKMVNRRPKLIRNAVDEIYFQRENNECLEKEAKNILSGFGKKKIAYCGSIKGVLNLEIVINSATYLSDYDFLFIGEVRYMNIERYDRKIIELFSLKNVHHIGPFGVGILPYLLRQMDILIFLYNGDKGNWTYYGGSAKLFEYMAMGKPIISTPHPDIYYFKKYIKIVENPSEFITMVRKSATVYTCELLNEMIMVAEKNTWKKRKKLILEDIKQAISSRR